MATLLQPAGQRITLDGIFWSTHQALLQDIGDDRVSRLACDWGCLDINVIPSAAQL